MNAISSRGFMLLLTDETGPLSSMQMPTSWRHHEQSVLEQLVRAAYPGLTVLGVEWATEPKKYTCSGDVLLVSVPGTHVVAVPKKRASKRVPAQEDIGDALLPDALHGYRGDWLEVSRLAPAPALKLALSQEVVNRCATCGTAYTAEAWAALPLAGAKDVREGGTIIHEDYRTCGCGSTRMIFTTRLAGEAA